jgi:carbon-monoxide dehydrogenase medium subunit
MVIAGGTDLIVAMKERTIQPRCLVSLEKIRHLDRIQYSDHEGLSMGPLATLRSIETNTTIRERFPILSQAAQSIGSVQIRNLGTLGGNLCHAAPSADMAPPLLCLDARARVTGMKGEKWVCLEDFLKGPNETALRDEEILTEIRIPPQPIGSAGIYLKHSLRRAMEIALVGVAVLMVIGRETKRCDDIKIALGAVAPIPFRAKKAEEALRGRPIHKDSIQKVAQLASEEATPIDDIRGSKWYRSEMVRELTMRGIEKIVDQVMREGKAE